MISSLIQGFNRIVGRSQGYAGLAVRDDVLTCTVNGAGTPCMTTAWEPTPEELAALNAGKPVLVRILGRVPPPMMVYVED